MKLPWEEIEELTKYLKKKGLAEITIETKEGKISIKKDSAGNVSLVPSSTVAHSHEPIKPEVVKQSAPTSNCNEITSPMVGTFYASPTPGAESFIQVGSKIKKGDVICIIEAMKIMNELPSEVSGTVKEILVNNGDVVEFGQVLVRVEA